MSKGFAGIAIALYACGFLIISLHNSRYGFSETNPFRPRMLAAGAWFFSPYHNSHRIVARYKDRTTFPGNGLHSYFTRTTSCVFRRPSSHQYFFSFSDVPTVLPSRWWWLWIVGGILALGVLVFVMESKRFPPIVSAISSLLLVLFFVQSAARDLFIARHSSLQR